MDSSCKPTVLITGANGFIAARTAKTFLDSGYNVRGTVRSVQSGETISKALAEFVSAGRFEFVIVGDITLAGAFDEAVKGCHAIAHLAAPVSLSFTDPGPVLHAAVNGTLSLLESALKQGTQLKTVVLMSSISAVMSPRESGHIYSEKDWNERSEVEVSRLGNAASGSDIYSASKTAAERAFWKFRGEQQPAFTMTAINPALVVGPPFLLPADPQHIGETVRDTYIILSGAPLPPTFGAGVVVDVRDVARLLAFIVAHPQETDGERYLAVSGVGTSQAIADILRKHYPERRSIIDEGKPGQGYRPDFDISRVVDASKAVKLTGEPWIKYEDSILAAAKIFERYI